jgi:hypothetical protein
LWQVPSDLKGEFKVSVQLVANPFPTDNSQDSTIKL